MARKITRPLSASHRLPASSPQDLYTPAKISSPTIMISTVVVFVVSVSFSVLLFRVLFGFRGLLLGE
ncbi:unnamed protein product [Pleuronectes platessa]|uniref:Uncharacterized protein n=1 Tax=Pleuronectes platessa TaxID=8262 RepID=A0A9N7UZL9_PLEPL|nr:unnamed protein product [Pleuronectes platessa]